MPTVRLLGPVDVIDDDGVVHTPGSPLRCTLLALLALQRCTAVDTEALLDRIWDGRPPASGLRALRFHISRLRSEIDIADLIVTVGSAYRLDAHTDLVRLTDGLAADTDADTLAALLATRRGDPFLGASACSALEHERRRLDELTLTITERHYQHSLANNDTSVISDLTRLCLEHPVRESLWAILIRAHYQAGNQADALRASTTLRINLRDELGVDPSRELQQLELQILDHDVPQTAPTREVPPLRTSTAPAGNLPHPLDSFIGRSDELGVLSNLIATYRLVTVVGVGGMGKTRLVVEACHRARSSFDGGVWFVDLALASSDSAVVEEAASLFGLQAVAGRSVEDRLIDHLESTTTLLVFDNCEHVMRPAAGLINRLLQACAGLKVVATSREALLLQGEHVMALGPLSMDDDNGDSGERCVDAVALFIDRLTAEGGPAIVDDHERAVVLEICRQLDGMPLAIELAAGRARTLGTTDVLARLGERLRLLSGGWRTGVGRQQTLSATLDWSYVLLGEREQVMFDRLAVFVGWFTLDDAVAVAADSTLGDLDVLESISALVDKSMCTVDLHATPTRYRYLETMRAYGRDHLDTSATLTEFRDRHAAHLAASASVIAQMLVGPDELEAARRAERLMPDLRAALGWAVDRHLDDVIDDIATLAVPMAGRGSHEATGWFHDLRHDLPDRPAVQAAAMYHALYTKTDHAETRRLAHRLIEMTGDGPWFGWFCLAYVEFNEGHYDHTVEYQTRAYEIGETLSGDLHIHTVNPALLATLLAATGRNTGDLVEQGFARARAAQWPTALAYAHYAAGLAILYTDPIASLEQLDHSLQIAFQVGNRQAEGIGQTLIDVLQSTVLPPAELAAALARQLRHAHERSDTVNALLPLSQVVVLLSQTDRLRTAALICGWLDGRSGRDAQTVGDHEAAIASVRQALGDQWDPLFRQGRSMTSTQIVDAACDELWMIG